MGIIRSLRSRMSMMKIRYVFDDRVTGGEVWEWQDRAGDFWWANARFGGGFISRLTSFRMRVPDRKSTVRVP